MKPRHWIMLVLVLIALCLAAGSRIMFVRAVEPSHSSTLLMPSLTTQIPTIDSIAFYTPSYDLDFIKVNEMWVQKNTHYPANIKELGKLLSQLSALLIQEEKSSKLSDLEKLGLITKNEALGKAIAPNAIGENIILSQGQTELHNLTIGYSQRSKNIHHIDRFYIRDMKTNKALLVAGEITLAQEPDLLLKPIHFSLDSKDILTLTIINRNNHSTSVYAGKHQTIIDSYVKSIKSIPVSAVFMDNHSISSKAHKEQTILTLTGKSYLKLTVWDDGSHYWLKIDDSRLADYGKWIFQISPATRRLILESINNI